MMLYKLVMQSGGNGKQCVIFSPGIGTKTRSGNNKNAMQLDMAVVGHSIRVTPDRCQDRRRPLPYDPSTEIVPRPVLRGLPVGRPVNRLLSLYWYYPSDAEADTLETTGCW